MTNSITIELRLIMKLYRNTVLNGLNTLIKQLKLIGNHH